MSTSARLLGRVKGGSTVVGLVYQWTVLDGESAVEAAQELGITSNAVFIAKSRALARFVALAIAVGRVG